VKEASGICKQVFKSKLKESPDIAEASSKRCRLKFMSDSVFCEQRNLANCLSYEQSKFPAMHHRPERKQTSRGCPPSARQSYLRL
jgi:hypothetical protein